MYSDIYTNLVRRSGIRAAMDKQLHHACPKIEDYQYLLTEDAC